MWSDATIFFFCFSQVCPDCHFYDFPDDVQILIIFNVLKSDSKILSENIERNNNCDNFQSVNAFYYFFEELIYKSEISTPKEIQCKWLCFLFNTCFFS